MWDQEVLTYHEGPLNFKSSRPGFKEQQCLWTYFGFRICVGKVKLENGSTGHRHCENHVVAG